MFVLDRFKKPLMPCTEKRARLLLERGRARIARLTPFTIRLTDRTVEASEIQPILLKVDPGSKFTGMALNRLVGEGVQGVVALVEVEHRGELIRDRLLGRGIHRRFRRSRLRFRPSRHSNRTRPKGWLSPSLKHRVDSTMSWVGRIRRSVPVSGIAVERTRFDTHLLSDPDVEGIGYQNGTLVGTEVREYVLERSGHRCAYCDKGGVPLQLDHVLARTKGGSDRVSNLIAACVPCNARKADGRVEEFVSEPARLERIKRQLKMPLVDAAAMNATRWILWRALEATGIPVEASTGGRTKWNRSRNGIPKTHALDAACVGTLEAVFGWRVPTFTVKATGRGAYQRTRSDAHGFPRGYLTRSKRILGFATGDRVRAVVPEGRLAGTYSGRVAVRAKGWFNLRPDGGKIFDVHPRHCTLLQRADGYAYGFRPASV